MEILFLIPFITFDLYSLFPMILTIVHAVSDFSSNRPNGYSTSQGFSVEGNTLLWCHSWFLLFLCLSLLFTLPPVEEMSQCECQHGSCQISIKSPGHRDHSIHLQCVCIVVFFLIADATLWHYWFLLSPESHQMPLTRFAPKAAKALPESIWLWDCIQFILLLLASFYSFLFCLAMVCILIGYFNIWISCAMLFNLVATSLKVKNLYYMALAISVMVITPSLFLFWHWSVQLMKCSEDGPKD